MAKLCANNTQSDSCYPHCNWTLLSERITDDGIQISTGDSPVRTDFFVRSHSRYHRMSVWQWCASLLWLLQTLSLSLSHLSFSKFFSKLAHRRLGNRWRIWLLRSVLVRNVGSRVSITNVYENVVGNKWLILFKHISTSIFLTNDDKWWQMMTSSRWYMCTWTPVVID